MDYPVHFRLMITREERLCLERLALAKGVSMSAIVRAGLALMGGDLRGKRYTPHGRATTSISTDNSVLVDNQQHLG
jgi:hypothetical protein